MYKQVLVIVMPVKRMLKLNTTETRRFLYLNTKKNYRISSSVANLKEVMLTDQEVVKKELYFKQLKAKDKAAFLSVLESFNESKTKRGHIEFIYAALKCMKEFNVNEDLEAYKKLMDVFPKGKMIPKNLIQAEFYHFPRQQDCAVFLLDQMEYNRVYPDSEMKEIILNTFGMSSHVFKKYGRMMYWMPKLKNINPYLVPDPLPSDIEQLAVLALKKMTVDPRTKITHFKAADLEDSLDKTWIVSAQSPVQQKLLLKHDANKPLYVDGPHIVWLEKLSLSYFVLRADPVTYPSTEEENDDDVSNLHLYMFGERKPKYLTLRPSTVHEQEDSIIYAMCATGTSSKDSALSWIRFLHETNPVLDTLSVLFTLRSLSRAVTVVNAEKQASNDDDTTMHNVHEEVK